MHLLLSPFPEVGGRPAIHARIEVIGIGNLDRGDDAAGPMVATAVRGKLGDHAGIDVRVTNPAHLFDILEGYEHVIIVDACESNLPLGSVVVTREISDESSLPSTHGITISSALRLARALGRRPKEVTFVLVAGQEFGTGRAPSPAVDRAIPLAAERVMEVISAIRTN